MDVFIAGLIAILIILAIAYWIICAAVDKIKEPYEAKCRLLEKQDSIKKEKEKYKQLSEATENRAKELEKEKEHYLTLEAELKSQIHAARVEENKFISYRKNLVERYNTAVEKAEAKIDSKAAELSEKIVASKISNIEKEYKAKLEELSQKEKRLDLGVSKMRLHPELVKPFSKVYDQDSYLNSIKESVLQHAFDKPPAIEEIGICAIIHSSTTEDKYFTSLVDCTCKDHKTRKRPCKHMLYLAFTIGLLQISQKNKMDIVTEYNRYGVKLDKTKEEIKISEAKRNKLEAVNSELVRVINEKPNAYPRIAGMMADIVALQFRDSEIYLRSKTRPAHKSADEVARMKEKVRTLVKYNEEWKDKVETLHNWFPNIDDVFNAGFTVDDWELEVREPTAHEIKDYISKYIKTVKFENLRRK